LEVIGILMGTMHKSTTKKTKDAVKPLRMISDNGDLFIVQQNDRRIALGLIARGGKKAGKLGYFFRIELYDNAPDKSALTLEPEQAIWIEKFGDLHILRGKWPLVGKLKGFTREAWRMPVFARHSDIHNVDYISTYDENDVSKLIDTWLAEEVPAHIDTSFVANEGLAGAGYVEDYLMKILGLRTQ
jgi:Immunity protein 26